MENQRQKTSTNTKEIQKHTDRHIKSDTRTHQGRHKGKNTNKHTKSDKQAQRLRDRSKHAYKHTELDT